MCRKRVRGPGHGGGSAGDRRGTGPLGSPRRRRRVGVGSATVLPRAATRRSLGTPGPGGTNVEDATPRRAPADERPGAARRAPGSPGTPYRDDAKNSGGRGSARYRGGRRPRPCSPTGLGARGAGGPDRRRPTLGERASLSANAAQRARSRSTRCPRIGTPSFLRRASCRSPSAAVPSERTTRYQGTSSRVVARTKPTRRGARRQRSPYVATDPRGISRTCSTTSASNSSQLRRLMASPRGPPGAGGAAGRTGDRAAS